MNCRSCKDKQDKFFVRFMFQVTVYTRVDAKAQQNLQRIAEQQQAEADAEPARVAAAAARQDEFKVNIPEPISEEDLASFQRKFADYIADYGWQKKEIYILMERQVMQTGVHDDIVPKYVEFFEKVVFGDKNSDHSMPTGVYDHFLRTLSNTIENSLSQVSDEEVNEYADVFKLQQNVDDGEREWLMCSLMACKIATSPGKSKFYVRYAVQVAVYSRMDVRMQQIQKDEQLRKSQAEILNAVDAARNDANVANEGGVAVVEYTDYGLEHVAQAKDEHQDAAEAEEEEEDEENVSVSPPPAADGEHMSNPQPAEDGKAKSARISTIAVFNGSKKHFAAE